VTREEADYVMNRLNFRPRKKIAFKTPYEVLFKTKINLTDQVALNT
jgi:IS30 family transposase